MTIRAKGNVPNPIGVSLQQLGTGIYETGFWMAIVGELIPPQSNQSITTAASEQLTIWAVAYTLNPAGMPL